MRYSEVVDEMLKRCRDKEEFGELEDEVERLAQATLPRARTFPAECAECGEAVKRRGQRQIVETVWGKGIVRVQRRQCQGWPASSGGP